ncbi:hypothetical protein LZ32DRAFT_604225 [Colletotrichum eremochloae]|nr:hypothetical protein LZ32DRAFT_604225 [Colletotrichum eremochloae]
MTASSTLWSKLYSSRSIPSIVVNHHHLLCQQTSARLITHRSSTTTPWAPHLKSQQPQNRAPSASRRPFMSSAARTNPQEQQQPSSISGSDWERLSPEAKIQWLGDDKWGWVVYRCSYGREFDGAWDDLKRRIIQGAREAIAKSDAPGIVETMDFVFVEDPALEGASVGELRRRFQTWARNDRAAAGVDMDDETQGSRGSRYEFFLKVDGEGLWNGHVGLVQGWTPSPGDQDWMKVRTSAVMPALYVKLDNPEVWYAYYTPPERGVCNDL